MAIELPNLGSGIKRFGARADYYCMSRISRAFAFTMVAGGLLVAHPLPADPNDDVAATQRLINTLLQRLQADEARIQQLEQKLAAQSLAGSAQPTNAATQPDAAAAAVVEAIAESHSGDHDHMMTLPGGPQLKINGFADINYGIGSVANHLIYPLQTPATSAFRLGEFDLFISSKIASHWNAVAEIVLGTDATNYWGLDIERLQLTYKPNEYFSISGGRYHTAIGYYNTAFHHGTWFQSAEGRPFMYYFEDSGGILPVHNVGLTATGLVPGSGRLGLHWVAEIGNGRSSSTTGQPVQNFISDRNYKSSNFAAYVQPVAGLQVGGSFYLDRLYPASGDRVAQHISSAYAVFSDVKWEFLNEAVLLSNILPSGRAYNTPLAYTQLSRKFGSYRPYFRYQYVNVPNNDPVNVFNGRYNGPSLGLRIDVTDYAAFKLQYNRVDQRAMPAGNGLNAQISFAF
jgi:hypothetical protein